MANELLSSLLKEYEQKKLKAEMDLEKRKDDLYNKIPRLREIENELNSSAILKAKDILLNGSKTTYDLKQTISLLKKEKEQILKDNGILPNYLEPFYECKICKDTGYITDDNYKTKMCNCLKQKLLDYSFNKSNMYNLKNENFSTFNENIFSDEVDVAKYRFNISPRTNIKNIKQKCIEFVQNFDNPNAKNLLFTGGIGLRKNLYVKLYSSRIIKKRKNCTLSNSSCFA